MPLFIVPAHVLNPDPVRAGVQATVISGGTAINGDETVIQTDGGGRIEITYGEFDLDEELPRRVWGVWQDELAGGAMVVLAPVLKLENAPIPAGAADRAFVANDAYFPISAGFVAPYVIAETVGAANLRATTITINMIQGATLKPDTWFGFERRAHKIKRILSVSGSQYTVEFSPPLRHDVADGTSVNFDWPVVQCRAVLGQDLIPSISLGKYGSISVAFVEDFSEIEE
jgi:hypothetical protein